MKNKLLTTVFAVSAVAAASVVGAQEIKGDAKAGESKVAMCIGCHGIKGYQATFPEVHKVPMISGQSAKYIVSALSAYRAGERKHPTMRGIADSLTDQDMADVAAYYSVNGAVEGVPAIPAKPTREATGKVAELLTKGACISCHGENFSKPTDPAYPKIAGQHADYLFVALKSYKTTGSNQIGRTNGVMAGVAKQFSNAELKLMANYLSTLDTELKVVPEKPFR